MGILSVGLIVRFWAYAGYCGFPHTQIKVDLEQMWFYQSSCYALFKGSI
ncbi:hypothetical protein VCR15J2_20567 [Vibrio coralliirubri]|nr:hypothetical protein VCR15J2_20567 [Vibrio coralliirubri]